MYIKTMKIEKQTPTLFQQLIKLVIISVKLIIEEIKIKSINKPNGNTHTHLLI